MLEKQTANVNNPALIMLKNFMVGDFYFLIETISLRSNVERNKISPKQFTSV